MQIKFVNAKKKHGLGLWSLGYLQNPPRCWASVLGVMDTKSASGCLFSGSVGGVAGAAHVGPQRECFCPVLQVSNFPVYPYSDFFGGRYIFHSHIERYLFQQPAVPHPFPQTSVLNVLLGNLGPVAFLPIGLVLFLFPCRWGIGDVVEKCLPIFLSAILTPVRYNK